MYYETRGRKRRNSTSVILRAAIVVIKAIVNFLSWLGIIKKKKRIVEKIVVD